MAPVSSSATAGVLHRGHAQLSGLLQVAGQTRGCSPNPNNVNRAPRAASLHALKWNVNELFKRSSKRDNQFPSNLRQGEFQFKGNTSELLKANIDSSKGPLVVHKRRVCVISSHFHGDSNSSRQARIRRLNQLYNKLDVTGAAESQSSTSQIGLVSMAPGPMRSEGSIGASLVHELPLCFVPWTLLPGSQEMLHVYEPHHVHLFETILAQPRPWRYCHMLASPGRRQHLIGVVAEVQEVERFSDGRMLLLVAATAKIRVLRPSQKVPFVLATVEKEQDEEESLVGALYPGPEVGLGKPSANKNGVRSSGPEWDPEVAVAAVMTHELRRREKELWDCYDQVRLLTAKLRMDAGGIPPPSALLDARGIPPLDARKIPPPSYLLAARGIPLPSALLAVLPPGRSPVPNNSPRPRSVEQAWEDPAEVVARVQRLSYTVGAALPDVKRAEGRQAFLQASSIRERMDLAADLMTQRCKELAARVAVKKALTDTSSNLGG
eukprot:TRINITY_DN18524_c0_g1_i1.p1 TRINITY_DN18524_c0_g1~~TRINITY_DN18524_c0_g1_i1.p1  ORF type:complete len:493 (+),score=46.56 TRINITY_DN18524_c0_g1_i1:471-1949(+)